MCIGVFDSRRMRWMPRSERIWPPSRSRAEYARCALASLRASAVPGGEPAGMRPCSRRHRRAARPKAAVRCGRSRIRARYCAGKAPLRTLPRRSSASTGRESRGSGNPRRTRRRRCSEYAPAPAPRARRAAAVEPARADLNSPPAPPTAGPLLKAGQSGQSSPRTSAMWLSPPFTSLS